VARQHNQGLLIVNGGARVLGSTPASLASLTLSASTVVENSSAGTLVGTLQGVTAGSTISLTDDAGGRFALSGNNVVAGSISTDFETSTSHEITVRETLGAASNSPRDTALTINVTNVFEQPDLGALSLDDTQVPVDEAATINILGATSGSTITGSVPDGLTLNSGARTITGTPTTEGEYTFNLVETLADSSNSPRTTAVTLEVVGAPASALGDLSDVTLTAPENGQELVFDGTEWVNQ
jgi:hypothetical protein